MFISMYDIEVLKYFCMVWLNTAIKLELDARRNSMRTLKCK